MRIKCRRETTFGGAKIRGFGLTFHYGKLGYTYGEVGLKMFLDVNIFIWYGFSIQLTWVKV